MKTIQILHLFKDGSNYIVEIDEINHFRGEASLSGYVVDSNNPYMTTGHIFCFSVSKGFDDHLLEKTKYYSDYDFEVLDKIEYLNWFEKFILRHNVK